MIEKVAFIGKMFSGKTSAATVLTEERDFIKMAFADPVKVVSAQMLSQLNAYLRNYGLPTQEWTYDIIQERKGEPQVRKLLQLVGTELGRELYDENVWVDILLKASEPLNKVVVDDCRFLNEAQALRENGYKIVMVTRPLKDRQRVLMHRYPDTWESIMDHPSETSLDDFEPDDLIFAKDLDMLRHYVLQYVESDN